MIVDPTLVWGAVGGAGVVFGILRGSRQEKRETDAERRASEKDMKELIDGRIKVVVGEQLIKITTILEEVQRKLPDTGELARDSERIEQLERKTGDQQRAIDQLFDLVRRFERNCARNGHALGSDTDAIPRHGDRT